MDSTIEAFLARNGLPPSTLQHCTRFAKSRFSHHVNIYPLRTQGYCSITLVADTEPTKTLVQFRPSSYKLDIHLAEDARKVHGHLAPRTRPLGDLFVPPAERAKLSRRKRLMRRIRHPIHPEKNDKPRFRPASSHDHRDDDDSSSSSSSSSSSDEEDEDHITLHAYALSLLPGVALPLYRLDPLPPSLASTHRANFVQDLASFYAASWRRGQWHNYGRPQTMIATSLRPRLEDMARRLPERYRPAVNKVLINFPRIETLPWVLTHGDMVPVNVLVDERTGGITGVIDWAEAEYLPFGIGLYGFEEMLSYPVLTRTPTRKEQKNYTYFPDIGPLRELFWSELAAQIPDLRNDRLRETVKLAALAGVLLWCGIAFDDGRLDRVVKEGKDNIEIAKLDLFLLDENGVLEEVENEGTVFERADDEEDVQEMQPKDRRSAKQWRLNL